MDVLVKILSAATELFIQYGFKVITMDDIARRAGISKKTLYQHFANKNEVVQEAVTWYKTSIIKRCHNEMVNSDNPIEALVRCMSVLDSFHRKVNTQTLVELARFYPECFYYFKNTLLSEDVEYIKENIVAGIKEGLYRPEINPEFMAKYRIELSLLIFNPNLLVNDRFSLSLVALDIAEHFLYGIMTEKGVTLYKKYKEQYLQKVSEL